MVEDHLSQGQGVERTSWPSFPNRQPPGATTIITIIVGRGLSTSPVQPIESRPWADPTACGFFLYQKGRNEEAAFFVGVLQQGVFFLALSLI